MVLAVNSEAQLAFVHAQHHTDHAAIKDFGRGVSLSLFEPEHLSVAAIQLEAIPEIEAVLLQIRALLLDADTDAGRHHLFNLEQDVIVALDGLKVRVPFHRGGTEHGFDILICCQHLCSSVVI